MTALYLTAKMLTILHSIVSTVIGFRGDFPTPFKIGLCNRKQKKRKAEAQSNLDIAHTCC